MLFLPKQPLYFSLNGQGNPFALTLSKGSAGRGARGGFPCFGRAAAAGAAPRRAEIGSWPTNDRDSIKSSIPMGCVEMLHGEGFRERVAQKCFAFGNRFNTFD